MYYSEDERLEIGGKEYKEFSRHHNRIMNVEVTLIKEDLELISNREFVIYKFGHRDARHAAAEIVIEAEREIEELKETVEMLEENLALTESYCDDLQSQLL